MQTGLLAMTIICYKNASYLVELSGSTQLMVGVVGWIYPLQ